MMDDRRTAAPAAMLAPATTRTGLLGAVGVGAGLSALVVATAWGSDTRLGAPTYWPWLLTGLQVTALWSAGARHWWGWLLGAAVQPAWIAYAVVTGQLGFVPGCAVSAAVQGFSYWRTGPGRDDGRRVGRRIGPGDLRLEAASHPRPS